MDVPVISMLAWPSTTTVTTQQRLIHIDSVLSRWHPLQNNEQDFAKLYPALCDVIASVEPLSIDGERMLLKSVKVCSFGFNLLSYRFIFLIFL